MENSISNGKMFNFTVGFDRASTAGTLLEGKTFSIDKIQNNREGEPIGFLCGTSAWSFKKLFTSNTKNEKDEQIPVFELFLGDTPLTAVQANEDGKETGAAKKSIMDDPATNPIGRRFKVDKAIMLGTVDNPICTPQDYKNYGKYFDKNGNVLTPSTVIDWNDIYSSPKLEGKTHTPLYKYELDFNL